MKGSQVGDFRGAKVGPLWGFDVPTHFFVILIF